MCTRYRAQADTSWSSPRACAAVAKLIENCFKEDDQHAALITHQECANFARLHGERIEEALPLYQVLHARATRTN